MTGKINYENYDRIRYLHKRISKILIEDLFFNLMTLESKERVRKNINKLIYLLKKLDEAL